MGDNSFRNNVPDPLLFGKELSTIDAYIPAQRRVHCISGMKQKEDSDV
jgi:hypothetical protein